MHIEAMSDQIKHPRFYAIIFTTIFLHFSFDANAHERPIPLRYEVLKAISHDPSSFTEGLVFFDGNIFESVGRYGSSALLKINPATGRLAQKRANLAQHFAEGLAILDNKIFQLTWREHTVLIYDMQFRPLKQSRYDTEGWGLASIKSVHQLVMSDGSSLLRFLDGKDFREMRRVTVHDGVREISLLNELEEVNGLIYANVWLTDLIAVIDPKDGNVLGWLDLSALKNSFIKPAGWNERENVLNGIAYDPESGHFFVTGKCWPAMFEIQIDRTRLQPQTGAGTATPQ
jgi:glutamine cyclotransferase